MSKQSIWQNNTPEEIIISHRTDIIKELSEFYKPEAALIKIDRILPFEIIQLEDFNEIFYISISSLILEKYPNIHFFDKNQKTVAILNNTADGCELLIHEDNYAIDITCNIKEKKSLSIKSRGNIYLSGNIKTQATIKIDCHECHIQDTEIIINNTAQSGFTSLETEQLTLRTTGNTFINKKVIMKTQEQIYFCSQNIHNEGTLTTPSLVLVADQFNNLGNIDSVDDITGFLLEFNNKTGGNIDVGHLISLSTYVYNDAGNTRTNHFNLLSNHAEFSGNLKILKSTSILTELSLLFHPKAILDCQGQFIAKCNQDIFFESKMLHANEKIEISSGHALNFSGYINTEKSLVILSAEAALTVKGILSTDNSSSLYFEAPDISIKDRIIKFHNIEFKSTNNLNINTFLSNSGALILNTNQLNIDAIIETGGSLDLSAINLNVTENGNILVKGSGKVICDVMHNHGSIVSQDTMYCGVNYLTYNLGNITGKSLQIDTAIYANLWGVCSDSSIKINALVSVSLGVIYAASYHCNALVELKSGVHLTSFPSANELFTLGNLIECSKLISRQIIPKNFQILQSAMQSYQLLKTAFSSTLEQLQNISSLFNKQEIPSLSLHKLIADIVKMKDIAFIAKSTLDQCKEIKLTGFKNTAENLATELSTLKVQFNGERFKKLINNIDHVLVGTSVISTITPANSSDSLVTLSSGIAITTHNMVRSLQMHNTAFNAALSSTTINAKKLTNQGGLFALGDMSLTGNEFRNENAVLSYSPISVKYSHVELASTFPLPMRKWQITGDNVLVENKQEIENSEIKSKALTIESQSNLNLKNSRVITEEFKQTDGSELHVESSHILTKSIQLASITELNNSTVHASGNLTQIGSLSGNNSTIHARNASLDGAILSGGNLNVENNLHVKHTEFTGMPVHANNIDLQDSTVNESKVKASENLSLKNIKANNSTLEGINAVSVTGKNEIKKTEIKSQGNLAVSDALISEYSTLVAKNIALSGDIKGIGKKLNDTEGLKIHATEALKTEKDCKIDAESLNMKSNVFENIGSVAVSDSFTLLADRMYNWGEFNTKGHAQFNVNQLLVNFNTITGDSININAGAFVNMWNVAGYDNLTINALASFNTGLMRSSHIRVSALVSYNLGLYLPSLPSTPGSYFSWDNISNVGKTLLYNVSPTMGSVVGVGLSAYRLKNSGVGLYNKAKTTSYSNLSEIIALAVGTMDLVVGAKQGYDSCNNAYTSGKEICENSKNQLESFKTVVSHNMDALSSEIKQGYESTKELYTNISNSSDYAYNAVSEMYTDFSTSSDMHQTLNKWKDKRFQTYKSTANSTPVSTIMDTIGHSVSTTSVAAINGIGISPLASIAGHVYSRNISEQGVWAKNYGTQGALNCYSSSVKYHNNDGKICSTVFRLEGNQFNNSGKVIAETAVVDVKSWNQNQGQTHIHGGKIHIIDFTASGGKTNLEHTALKIDGALSVESPAQIILNKESHLNARDTKINGAVLVTEKSSIKITDKTEVAGTIHLDQSSMEAGKLTSSTTGQMLLNNKSHLQATDTLNAGLISATQSSAAMQNYHGTQSSKTNFENNSGLSTKTNMEIHGQLNANESVIAVGNKAILGKNANTEMNNSTVCAKDMQISSSTNLERTTVNVNETLSIENAAQITLKNESHLITKEARITGTIVGS